ncbi:MAG: regulatory protein RecX [Melioribacteraceae bacterium]
MTVTNVTKKKNKVIVSFDEDEDLIFPYELFLKNTLFEDDEVTEKERETYSNEIQLYLIKQNSFRYLSGRNHSKFELKVKLLKKKYNKELIEVILNELEDLKYLDDKEFANYYFKIKLKRKKGVRLIQAELSKKGVRREIIEEVSLDFIDDPILEKSALIISEKKLLVLKRKDLSKSQLRQKVFQFLMRKGYSTEIIKSTIDKLKFE